MTGNAAGGLTVAANEEVGLRTAIRLSGVRKLYGNVPALAGVELEIAEGEFFTMLGPSGSGKTTLLRLIAGFERPDGGTIALGGTDMSHTPPFLRPVNTVFQDYALFPHMTVAENVEYGLRVAKVPRPRRRERAARALEMVQLTGFGARKPAQLSGGQRQRVALARAIVNEPLVLLLDEPLGALDLKLRQEMQIELKRIHRELGMTFVYVTHDQEEALTMSDRIAVMRDGRIEQVGTPVEVYERPDTEFVAGFIGVSNLLRRDGRLFTVRPEKLRLTEIGDSETAQSSDQVNVVAGTVEEVIYLGTATRFIVTLASGERLVVVRQNQQSGAADAASLQGAQVQLSWNRSEEHEVQAGTDAKEEEL